MQAVNYFCKTLHLRCFSFFNRVSLHARLNSCYKAWSYKEKNHKMVKAYRESV